jgi:VanZ family protein
MRPLRFANWWFAGGVLLLAYVLYATLAPDIRPIARLVFNDKLAHFLAFAALMAWFSGVVNPRLFPLVAILLAALGVGIEFLQAQLTYRTAEVADALFDFAGIGVAWVLARAGLGRWAEFVETHILRV